MGVMAPPALSGVDLLKVDEKAQARRSELGAVQVLQRQGSVAQCKSGIIVGGFVGECAIEPFDPDLFEMERKILCRLLFG